MGKICFIRVLQLVKMNFILNFFCCLCRAELLTLYERVILTDIEFSDSQNLDQALWKNVFYQVIERFRQLLKDQTSDTASQIKTMLMTLLEEVDMYRVVYILLMKVHVIV